MNFNELYELQKIDKILYKLNYLNLYNNNL